MSTWFHTLAAALMLVTAAPLVAAPASPEVRAEINALLDSLASSQCEFKRNGSWHTAAEAKTHLLRKLAYIEDKGKLRSTEQFIELAASASSLSGKPYQVRCAGAEPMDSAPWLKTALARVRAAKR